LSAGRVRAAIEERAADAERVPGKRQHAPELSRSDDTDVG